MTNEQLAVLLNTLKARLTAAIIESRSLAPPDESEDRHYLYYRPLFDVTDELQDDINALLTKE